MLMAPASGVGQGGVLYVSHMSERLRAWRPAVPGVREVLHATFEQHAYPAHTHDAWTVLLIDAGAVSYRLGRATHLAEPASVTLLPPFVAHDGRSALAGHAFRKRVLYLEAGWLPPEVETATEREPTLRDPRALRALAGVHAALASPDDALEAENGVLALQTIVRSRLCAAPSAARDAPLAHRLKGMLDDRLFETFTLAEAAEVLGAHPSHLVRAFSRAYGIPPHRYVTGRRIDHARRLLLGGWAPAEAAVASGFYDQAHLTRHFHRTLGVTPAAFAA